MYNLAHFSFEVKYLEYAPDTTNCPKCGTTCKRDSKGERNPIDIDLNHSILLHIVVGVYECIKCHSYFRIQSSWIHKSSHYTDRAKQKSNCSVSEDQMPFSRVTHRLSRDFNISPSKSSVWKWFYYEAKQLDLFQDYLPYVIASFSGVLCTDELYDKKFCIVLSTDPLNNNIVYFEICDDILKAVRSYGKSLPKEKPLLDNIPTSVSLSTKTGLSDKQLISQNRYLFTTKPKNLSPKNNELLGQLLKEHPPLQIYRDFILDIFDIYKSPIPSLAKDKFQHIITNQKYLDDKFLSNSIDSLKNAFHKSIVFLDYTNLNPTNNHVERAARLFRKRQKSHYRIRTKDTIRLMFTQELFRQLRNKQLSNIHPVLLQKRTAQLYQPIC